ncbi:MAG: metal ABC transporter solute-binding protein, Zn/Mn family, partial [Microcystis sp.]|uniref:metal ABC transporter solute-binding protein, Zn/Mn family n=1 Tax=Microcystis sp. TaxID=1127 RepID=UPI00391ACE31
MKKLILSCLFLGLVACNPSVNTTNNQKPKVISTSTIIADLTAGVGGEEIDHQDILKPGDDPHVYEPVPADSVALEKADLILYNGYNLEPGLIKMINSTAVKAKKVAVGEAIKPLQLEKEGHKVPDPHVWGSAKNGIIMVEKIRDQLIELSPEDKEIFTANAAQLISELENLDRWITAAIETIPPSQRQLVTTHDAFQYYAHAYG